MVAALAFLSYLTSFALPYAMLRFGGAATDLSSLTNAFLVFSALTSMLAAADSRSLHRCSCSTARSIAVRTNALRPRGPVSASTFATFGSLRHFVEQKLAD